MSSVFLSHALEDKTIVEHIYGRLIEQYPDVKPWLDKYELIGGDSLTERIAEGINRADKFVVFLSATSILKPWVLRELRKALALELERNESFIIPVIIDELPKVPDFLEDKVYVDMRHMTEPEFLRALYAAIKGLRGTDGVGSGGVENLRIVVTKHAPNKVIEVSIVPQYWAEDVAFEIEVSKSYKNTIFAFSKTGPGMGTSIVEEREERIELAPVLWSQRRDRAYTPRSWKGQEVCPKHSHSRSQASTKTSASIRGSSSWKRCA